MGFCLDPKFCDQSLEIRIKVFILKQHEGQTGRQAKIVWWWRGGISGEPVEQVAEAERWWRFCTKQQKTRTDSSFLRCEVLRTCQAWVLYSSVFSTHIYNVNMG